MPAESPHWALLLMVGQGINLPMVPSVLCKIERMPWGQPLLQLQHPQRAVLEGLVAGCRMLPNSTTAGISRVMWELAGQGQPLWLHFQTQTLSKSPQPLLPFWGGHTWLSRPGPIPITMHHWFAPWQPPQPASPYGLFGLKLLCLFSFPVNFQV